MDKAAWAFLESLWSEVMPKELECCSCRKAIHADDVLSRTFTITSQGFSTTSRCARKIPVPALDDTILIFHRHLECLFQKTRYVTISHVWDSQLADLQYNKRKSTASAHKVKEILLDVSVRIARGLIQGFGQQEGPFEIWHDYISVPQWSFELKAQIIRSIPDIYHRSFTTLAHLPDVDVNSTSIMRQGHSVYERAHGATDLCTSRWFSRVWTAMELTQSRKLRVMLKDFILLPDDARYESFLEETEKRRGETAKQRDDPHAFGKYLSFKNTLAPWQLGPLNEVRRHNLKGTISPFATAHLILACRCVTNPRDFFHAMIAMLRPDVSEPELNDDPREAMLQIARSCLKAGDFSPLFMTPATALREPTLEIIRTYGYTDLTVYSLGMEECAPQFPDVKFTSIHPSIDVECIGTVQIVKHLTLGGPDERFRKAVKFVLETTGLDSKEFATTLGVRLYGQELQTILQRLYDGERTHSLSRQLSELRTASPENENEIISQIAESIGLSKPPVFGGRYLKSFFSPIQFLDGHGYTLHLGGAGAVAGVTCSQCHKTFLIRVALLRPPSEVVGAQVYRVPGLKYRFTHQGGCGWLLKEGHIVGRFIWGAPTCGCKRELEEKEIVLEELPSQTPNTHPYDNKDTANPPKPFDVGNRLRWHPRPA
ncbi:hypothetical protein F5Y16DRAFT_415785 [Xylariaceae sp. FL0255]|nr:hypothetical protein F5Y16DRAFT_415785 [Xylariaceae sp. FL0255]